MSDLILYEYIKSRKKYRRYIYRIVQKGWRNTHIYYYKKLALKKHVTYDGGSPPFLLSCSSSSASSASACTHFCVERTHKWPRWPCFRKSGKSKGTYLPNCGSLNHQRASAITFYHPYYSLLVSLVIRTICCKGLVRERLCLLARFKKKQITLSVLLEHRLCVGCTRGFCFDSFLIVWFENFLFTTSLSRMSGNHLLSRILMHIKNVP